ncbi:MAG: hypothetical protein EXR69_11385 [Myxococcales bacterium]|nr:hypothetical protein [Myxococcales bacterium]
MLGVVGFFLRAGVVFGGGVLVAIASFVRMQLNAKRDEVPGNLAGITNAELAYYGSFGTYIAVGPAPRSVNNVGKDAVPWLGSPAWEELGWRPDGDVRGVYWVELTPTPRRLTPSRISPKCGTPFAPPTRWRACKTP